MNSDNKTHQPSLVNVKIDTKEDYEEVVGMLTEILCLTNEMQVLNFLI